MAPPLTFFGDGFLLPVPLSIVSITPCLPSLNIFSDCPEYLDQAEPEAVLEALPSKK